MKKTLLVEISGADAPGITAKVATCIEEFQGKLLDIEQAVTQLLLSLMMVVELEENSVTAFEIAVRDRLKDSKLELSFSSISEISRLNESADRFVVTLLAQEIPIAFWGELTRTLAQMQINLDSIKKLSSKDLSTIEFIASSVSKINFIAIKERLLAISAKFPGTDLAVQKENLYRRSKRLVVFDMDSTLIQGEVIDELAELAGKKAEVSELTRRAMNGEMDFQESLTRRVSMLKGLTKKDLDDVYSRIVLSPGAGRLIKILKRLGFRIGIISGGFTYFVERLKNELGVNYAYANSLEIEDGEITGRLQGLIVDGRRKADLMEMLAQQEGILLDQVIAIGDGANDIQMLKKAGLGIAYNAKAFTRSMVGTTLTTKSMESILYLLGINDRDIADMGIH